MGRGGPRGRPAATRGSECLAAMLRAVLCMYTPYTPMPPSDTATRTPVHPLGPHARGLALPNGWVDGGGCRGGAGVVWSPKVQLELTRRAASALFNDGPTRKDKA